MITEHEAFADRFVKTTARTRFGDSGRYQELPQLAQALERATAKEPGMLDPPAAVGA